VTTEIWLGGAVIVYVIAMMVLSWWAGKYYVEHEGQFMLGGRQFNSFLSVVGNTSILVSGGWLPAIVLYGYLFGVGGTWFYLAWGIALFVTMLLWAGLWRISGAYTPSEWFEYRYGRIGRLAVALIILLAVLAITGWQFVGSGASVAGVFGISETVAILLIGAAVIVYVALGGIWAATLTDLVQWSWVILVVFLAVPAYLFFQYGFPSAADVPEGFLSFPFGTMPIFQLTLPSVFTFLILQQSIANQAPYFARAASAMNRRTVTIAWTWSLIIALLTGMAGSLVGIYARMLMPDLENPEAAFGAILTFLPVWLAALALAGLIASTMSTVDIYLVSGVNQLVRDVAQLLMGMRDSQQLLRWAKWATVLYGAAAVIFAATWTAGLEALFGFGTAIGAPLFVFFLDSWLLKVGNGRGVVASVLASLFTVFVWQFLTDLSTIVDTLWIVFPVAFITLMVVSLLSRTSEMPHGAEEVTSLHRKIIEGVAKGYSSAGDIVDYCATRETGMQLPTLLREIDYLIDQGYLRRQGERLTKQLYFELNPEGEHILAEIIGAEERRAIQNGGLGSEASNILKAVQEKPGITTVDIHHKIGIAQEIVGPTVEILKRKSLVKVHGLITPRVSPTEGSDRADQASRAKASRETT
jgi:SSS family solute:Na+ symporter